MPTPEVVEAHLQDIHILATKAEVKSAANKPATLTKFEVGDSMDLRELKYLNNARGLTQHSPGFRTMKGSIEMDVVVGSAIIATIKAAYANRAPFYIACIEDTDAVEGGQGILYEVVAGSFPKTLEAGSLVKLSVEIGVNDFESI